MSIVNQERKALFYSSKYVRTFLFTDNQPYQYVRNPRHNLDDFFVITFCVEITLRYSSGDLPARLGAHVGDGGMRKLLQSTLEPRARRAHSLGTSADEPKVASQDQIRSAGIERFAF